MEKNYESKFTKLTTLKIFDKKEKTVATKVQKSGLEKYGTENVKLLKKIWVDAFGCC